MLRPTTTISILRLTSDVLEDPYTESLGSGFSPVATGIPAHISAPSGSETVAGGEQASLSFHLTAEVCDLDHVDRVLDEKTGATYLVDWAYTRPSPLAHTSAGLHRVEGLA